MRSECILVTGGAGFIGSNFVLDWIKHEQARVVVLDNLTYAGNLQNLDGFLDGFSDGLVKGDIGDRALVRELLLKYQPQAVVNFAAESHVDRSILGPADFIQTNIVGTFNLVDEVRSFWLGLQGSISTDFRFLHVSTDEVYGSLTASDRPFTEATAYAPNSPYAASKAASDHLVRAYRQTYGLPTLTTNCSNNYGPFQFPEKLIPTMTLNALEGKPLPLYGDGLNVRDWLHVSDHCAAIRRVLRHGQPGETYNIGGDSERSNLDVVLAICGSLDDLRPESPYVPHAQTLTFVADRLGHDRRYAVDSSKIKRELGWRAETSCERGIRATVKWYLDHQSWVDNIRTGAYQQWDERKYGAHG